MADKDQRLRFDEIVAHLTTDDPSLRRLAEQAPRPVAAATRVAVLVAGAVTWALLSVAMVAWGWAGIVLTFVIVAGAAGVASTERVRERWAMRL